MDKILIAGGAGFIGSMVNKMLHAAGYNTVVLDNLSRGNASTVLHGEFVEGDIGDPALLDRLFTTHSFAAVMHFAAFTDVGESVKYPEKYYVNNVSKTLILIEKMIAHGIRNFIFSSTAAVYGNPIKLPLSETHPLHPINPYGRTKLMIEEALKDLNINYTCLRYFNAAGGDPDGAIKVDKLNQINLIPLLYRYIKENKKTFTINGDDYETPDGTCVRDYIHIYDLGTAHIKAMERLMNGGSSAIYNLGNEHGFSIKEVITTVEKVTRHPIHTLVGPRRAGDPATLVADASKAKTELGWTPIYPDLNTIIEHGWRAYSVDKMPPKH